MYYGVIMAAVLLFSLQFLSNQTFQKQCGSHIRATLIFSTLSNIAGLLALLIINGFRFEYTLFSAIMALITAINNIVSTFCGLKAFDKINLSLYSTISMLGGMVLPFLAGILFYGESLTVGKIICVIIIAAALFLTVKKDEKKNSGRIYYIGIFVCNGLSGIISKIFQASPFAKTSDAGYSILIAVITLVLSAVLLLFVKGPRIKLSAKAFGAVASTGILNKIGNFLLLISLSHVHASAQYPMVTGGVMIFSTVISYFTHQRPSKREVGAVILAFIGALILVF